MSAFEASYSSLLQGVSQQNPRERLPGQVQAQSNMISDPVSGPRRRPGARFEFSIASDIEYPSDTDSLLAWYTDVAGSTVHILLNTNNGRLRLLDSAYNLEATLEGGAYLTATDSKSIRATTVGDEFFLLNTEQAPTLGGAVVAPDPDTQGCFYVVAGAFSKTYSITVATSTGSATVSYTTPSGSGPSDASLATPDYIATQLANALDLVKVSAGLSAVHREASYVYVLAGAGVTSVTVNSSVGLAFIMPSKDSYFTEQGNLPARLPVEADGYIVRVGDVSTPQYFQYDSTSTAWLESGAYGSPGTLENMPVAISREGATWVLYDGTYEGRFAGDDESNPSHRFVGSGITGISSYQGRLVLLSGAYCSMSASSKPRRFYRSTVTSVLEGDCIEVGSSANSSATYEYALQFMKDLVLFSSGSQALVPSTGSSITPRTATVVNTSAYAADMTCSPVLIGRTIMYSIPRSEDFFGLLEMVPSQYTDSQYTSVDSTQHIPKYMGGRCRFGASSGVAGLAVFGPSGDKRTLLVHEYIWSNDTKEQQAWHQWSFEYEIATAYFAKDLLHILFVQNGLIVGCTIDPRVGVLTSDVTRRPFLDLYSSTSIVEHIVTPPAWLAVFDPEAYSKIALALTTGDLAGEPVGFDVVGTDLVTVRSHPDGPVAIGVPYRSSIVPTRPIPRDRNDAPISTTKMTVLRFAVGTANSSAYTVAITDNNTTGDGAFGVGTLFWSSTELSLGHGRVAGESLAIVPARTNASSTILEIYTEGTGELNIVSLDHVSKFTLKVRR